MTAFQHGVAEAAAAGAAEPSKRMIPTERASRNDFTAEAGILLTGRATWARGWVGGSGRRLHDGCGGGRRSPGRRLRAGDYSWIGRVSTALKGRARAQPPGTRPCRV